MADRFLLDPISTVCVCVCVGGGGGGGWGCTRVLFLPVTFLFLSQFPSNLVTFPKI